MRTVKRRRRADFGEIVREQSPSHFARSGTISMINDVVLKAEREDSFQHFACPI
jgi:hypothetical protein